MQLLHLLCSLVFISGALGLPSRPDNPVCIVGAGPSGLTAAARLEAKGYKTVLFDRQAEVGGKCQAIYDNGSFAPLGALLYTNGTYTETAKIIERVGVRSFPFSTTQPGGEWLYNGTSGLVIPQPEVEMAFAQLLGQEVARYAAIWQQEFAPRMSPGYKKGVPLEYTVSTAEWLASKGFKALPAVFVPAMIPYGYDDYRQTPVLYMLQYVTPDILQFFVGQKLGNLIDFHEVWSRFSRTLKSPIRLSTTITCIDRTPFPTITYTVPTSPRPIRQPCSHLILAFPPTLSALTALNMPLTPSELQVFTPVGVTNYFSAATRLNIPFGDSFQALSPDAFTPVPATGAPVAVLRLSPTSNVATSWSWGKYRTRITEAEGREKLKATLSKINKDPRVEGLPKEVTDADILAFRKWDYFPRFDSEQLRKGWYGKYNQLQGKRNTFWTSGLNGLETVEWAVRGAQDLVDSYF